MTTERIHAKIRKLLALAADPSAQGAEAETAARQAAKLMAQYEVDLAALDEAQLAAQWDMTTVQAQGCRPGKKNAKEVPPWIGIIAWGVKIYTRTRASQGFGYVTFKGPREDIELARWLHEFLLHQAYEASKGYGLGEANRFRNGYAAAVQKRLKELTRDREQEEAGTGTSLVVVKDSRQREMDKFFGPEGNGKKSQVGSSAAGYAAGMAASIPTNRPLTRSSNRLLGA